MPGDIDCLYHEHAKGVPIYTIEEFSNHTMVPSMVFTNTNGRERVDRSFRWYQILV